ncbi:hypothetical protein [Rhizobium sp. NRK18]|uniref:hypothetical protein n=1 Tax=Rhizobium sp. NRK18 TaxID=2964667 RepID=UPI0021C4BDAD|nr:hypothetical protein [Rhizobium sp. NRK18]MCQ2002371.1 hypothetical protein [Rhizobium sp. NRK18]
MAGKKNKSAVKEISERKFELPFVEMQFRKSFIKQFDGLSAIKILGDPRSSYPGHKEVLRAGFIAWVFFPADHALRKKIMASAMLKMIIDAERKATEETNTRNLLTDFYARHIYLSKEFFSEIYYPLGGAVRFRSIDSGQKIQKKVIDSKRTLLHIFEICKIHHFLTEDCEAKQVRRKSLAGSNKIIKSLNDDDHTSFEAEKGFRPLSERAIEPAWVSRKATLPLIYASGSIKRGDGTLFSSICSGTFPFHMSKPLFDEWIAKARYVASDLFSGAEDSQLSDLGLENLPRGKKMVFTLPALSDKQIDYIRRKGQPTPPTDAK